MSDPNIPRLDHDLRGVDMQFSDEESDSRAELDPIGRKRTKDPYESRLNKVDRMITSGVIKLGAEKDCDVLADALSTLGLSADVADMVNREATAPAATATKMEMAEAVFVSQSGDPLFLLAEDASGPVFAPTHPSKEIISLITGMLVDAEGHYDTDAFLKLMNAFNHAGLSVQLQIFRQGYVVAEHLKPIQYENEMVTSTLMNAHGETRMAGLVLNEAGQTFTNTAFVSSTVWTGSSIGADPGMAHLTPLDLTQMCQVYVRRTHPVLRFPNTVNSVERNPWPCYNSLIKPDVVHALFPMCLAHPGGGADHWVLIIVHIERSLATVSTPHGDVCPIKKFNVLAYDPWKSHENPYIPTENLLCAATNAMKFIYTTHLVTLCGGESPEYDIFVMRGGQEGGLSCGMWVMTAIDAALDIFSTAEWTRINEIDRLDTLAWIIKQASPSKPYRRDYLSNICDTLLTLFQKFEVVRNLKNPFLAFQEHVREAEDEARRVQRQKKMKLAEKQARRAARKASKPIAVRGPLEPPDPSMYQLEGSSGGEPLGTSSGLAGEGAGGYYKNLKKRKIDDALDEDEKLGGP
jgi:hypothetical protein